jgi:hypothetical protein
VLRVAPTPEFWCPLGRVAQPLNFGVAVPSRIFEGTESLTFPDFVFDSADGVDADQPVFGIRVERKAAPGLVLGMFDQFSLQRIHVHVVQFFDLLLQTPHLEIVETPLPKTRERIDPACEVQIQLSGVRSPLATVEVCLVTRG